MAVTTTELRQALRDRLSDNESAKIFEDGELDRHIANAVFDFSHYRPTTRTTTVTLVSGTTEYALPDDCLVIVEVKNSDGAVLPTWAQRDGSLLVPKEWVESTATVLVSYDAVHVVSSTSYTTIPSYHKNAIADFAESACLSIMAMDMAKRPSFADTQVRVDHQDASSEFARRAIALRNQAIARLSRPIGGVT